MKDEKTIKVWSVIPNDSEFSTVDFTSYEQAVEWAKTYKDGAFVSPEPIDMPVRIYERKQMNQAKYGYRL